MSTSAARSVLFFRVYREVALPLYTALVRELCDSSHLPFQLATTLEDIGQAFIGLAAEVNGELKRRGILDQEVEADQTIEAQIETLLTRLMDGDRPASLGGIERGLPALKTDILQQAIKIALVMTHDLPTAGKDNRSPA
ncbi:hypothetical protein [Methylobacterium brachiatum]|uniref:hypothetical protein n=1 Tax=Methylobacterium brachiatum TaxID=269660 RepID=UPI00244AA5E1|nr:hypothetical protein [Methylobacterium brachiatum]MDH2310316.1 hypothetical protein [Methylobacterium brachiatum]